MYDVIWSCVLDKQSDPRTWKSGGPGERGEKVRQSHRERRPSDTECDQKTAAAAGPSGKLQCQGDK